MQDQNKIYSVSEVNSLLKQVIEKNRVFSLMLVSGEIVSFKRHSSGHLYFSMKDNSDRIKCIMFNRQSRYLSFRPQDGMNVLVQGRLSVYTKSGEYQLYVDSIHRIGVGELHFKFLELKERLARQGYFDQSSKRDIPKIPQKIGIITSLTGAAIRDILKTVQQKYPPVEIIIAPAQVQGKKSASEIAASLELLNKIADLDVIILSRGGGAVEELWSFNEERVIVAIKQSRVPVVSAVGHEIDTTLSDLAADKTAATPTAAAELVVPNISELYRDTDLFYDRITQAVENHLQRVRSIVKIRYQQLKLYRPSARLDRQKEYIRLLHSGLQINFELRINSIKDQYRRLEKRIAELNPKRELVNGYALVYNDTDGNIISSVTEVKLQDRLKIELYNGSIIVKVLKKEVDNDDR